MENIDIAKVTKSFDHLAETKAGQKSLIDFRQAIENLRNGIPEALDVNNHEFLLILQKLVNQMNAKDLTPPRGALSEAQLDGVVGGAYSSMFSVSSVQLLGDYRTIGNLGFNIMIVA